MQKLVAHGGKAYAVLLQLSSQPLSAVHTDLDVIGKPGLETDIHESELFMVKVEVQMLAFGPFHVELWEPFFG